MSFKARKGGGTAADQEELANLLVWHVVMPGMEEENNKGTRENTDKMHLDKESFLCA